jgi:uncharacterized protein (DUF952 family)
MSALIYHVTTLSRWNEFRLVNSFESETLQEEGFIHCAARAQVHGVLERYFAGQKKLLLLHIHTERLKAELKYEVATNGEKFPHVYGPINRDAVVSVEEL